VSHLKLFLLGTPRIESEDRPVEVDTRKAIALLAYLAVTQRPHGRDALATLLWPEYSQTRARATLRRTLSSLKTAGAEDSLHVDRQSVGLNRSAVWFDVERFRKVLAECREHGHPETEVCRACLSPLAEAAALYRDDFMAGFTLRDSAAFDDWQFFEAQSLRQEVAGALQKLVRLHGELGGFEPAIEYARRWLALDPLHEPAHRSLMRLYAWVGHRAAAVRQYRECVRIFDQELGVSPLEETTRLYQEIKENRPPPPPSTPRPQPRDLRTEEEPGPPLLEDSANAQLPESPLVGRSEEWMTLLHTREAAATDGHITILEGEAGIGKTRLAEEFLAHVRATGAVTLAARCYAGETDLAYGPIIEVLKAAINQPHGADRLERVPARSLTEAARLLPELASRRPDLPPAVPLDTPGAQSRFFEGVREVLLALCGGPPPAVLFLDDVHWADAASLELLAYLVRRMRGRPLYLLATWRSEQVPAGHRLRELLAEAQRARTATILPLARLSRSAVIELARLVAGEEALHAGLGDWVYDETEGLPLFVEEYLTAIARGALGAESDAWLLPGGVRELLHGRLQGASETGWQLLGTAAVIGRSFDFDTLREASGRSEEEAITGLEELISLGLVREVRSGADEEALLYDFSHEKLRALVYEETSLARRRLLHRRIAGSFAGRIRGNREAGPLAAQIAHHYRLAGQEAEAASYFKLAGEHARSLYANAEALAHFRTALALGHPATAALHEAIGDLLTLLGEYPAALVSYENVAALGGDPATLVSVERKLGIVHQRRGEWELAESHFQTALAALGESESSSERARLHADISLAVYHRGEMGRAADLARRALNLAESAGDKRALAQAHNMLGMLARSRGDQGTSLYHLEQSLALAEDLDDPSARVAALNNLALARGAVGEAEQAIDHIESALAVCTSLGDRHREAALHNNLADLLHAAGRSEESMHHLKQAVEVFAEIGVEAGTARPEIWKLTEW
jgi:DNA-binding SARP family transcriptional activator